MIIKWGTYLWSSQAKQLISPISMAGVKAAAACGEMSCLADICPLQVLFFKCNILWFGLVSSCITTVYITAALSCVVEHSCCRTAASNTLIKTIKLRMFFIPPDKIKGQDALFYSTVSLQWIKAKWLGLSLSPWKLFNIVMTTSNRGGKKIKRDGGTLNGVVIEADSTNPDESSEWTSISASFSFASAHLLSWICLKPSINPSSRTQMESLRCEEDWAATAPCWWSHQNIPFCQIKASRWAIINSEY